MELLTDFLKKRAQINFDRLLAQVESITPDQAFEGRMENWPIHSFGIGQDGSIAGIVIHVAAWKHLTLPIFIKDEVLNTRDDLDINSFCEINDWTSVMIA